MRSVVVSNTKHRPNGTSRHSGFISVFFLTLLFLCLTWQPGIAHAQSTSSQAQITGEVSVEITDYFDTGRHELRYFIIDRQSRARTEVFFPGQGKGLINKNFRTGNIVKVHGKRRPNGRDVDYDSVELLEYNAVDDPVLNQDDPTAEAVVAAPVTKKVLTLLVDFNDAVVYDYTTPANTPHGATLDDVKNRMFLETKNVAHFYNTASLGTLTIPSSAPGIPGEIPVYGPYKIDMDYLDVNTNTCSSSSYVSAALTKWEAATGQSRNDYTNHSLILPNYRDYDPQCTFGGQAQLGCGSNCWAVSMDPVGIMHGVIAHEIGHNFDFNHARTDTNNDGTFNCEYCDSSDFMGGSRNWMKFNPPHFEFKGWYDQSSYEIRTITPSSTLQSFDLIPVDEDETEWAGLRAIKTARTGSTNYYLSYRQRTGHYDNVSSSYTTGASLHWRGSNSYSYFYRMIKPGEIFTDAAADLVVRGVGSMSIDDGFGNTTNIFTLEICNTTCSTLFAPANLSASGTFPDTISLSWQDISYNEDGFTIEFSPDGSAWSALGTAPAEATSFSHFGLSEGSTFYYRVRAYRDAGETSDWSNTGSAATPPTTGLFGFPVTTSNDDVEQMSSDGWMYFTSGDIDLGLDSWAAEQHHEGLRFQNVAVPQGSTINNAYIRYRSSSNGTGSSTINIRVEDTANAPAFASTDFHLDSLTFSAVTVPWTLTNWSGGSYYQTPGLTAQVQPIINKAGWAGGNSMAFVNQGTQTGTHATYSFDNGSGPATLFIDYTWTPVIPSPPNAIAASDITNNSFQANWDSSAGATGYRLDVSASGSFDSFVSGYNNLDVGNVTLKSVTGLSPDTMYSYRIRAYNAGGTSGNSNTISLTSAPAVETCNAKTVGDVIENFDITHEACEMLVLSENFVVADGVNVIVNSGWVIDFKTGFIVEQGATLKVNVCGQSLCLKSGSPMPGGCHSCVDQICAIDSACCDTAFGASCLEKVSSVCGLVCE